MEKTKLIRKLKDEAVAVYGIDDKDEVDAGRNPTVNEAAVIQIINSILLDE